MSESSTSLDLISENGVPLSAEAARQCQESAAAQFARVFLGAAFDEERKKPNPDYNGKATAVYRTV